MQAILLAITPDAEKVIEAAGRTAYQSIDRISDAPVVEAEKGKTIRVFHGDYEHAGRTVRAGETLRADGETWTARRVWRNSADRFIRMLIGNGHLSVLEHASASVRLTGVSRALTHQLVRHRMASFTQQSQRYVNEETFGFVEPPSVAANPESHEAFVDFMERSRDVYHRLQEMGVRNEDARFVLPNAVESEIVITANLREWRHLLETRGESAAQWEIRRVAGAVLRLLRERAPAVFGDLEWDEEKETIVKR
jgi:thymidylate synthase (FAD)